MELVSQPYYAVFARFGGKQFKRLARSGVFVGGSEIFENGWCGGEAVDARIDHKAKLVNQSGSEHGAVDNPATLKRDSSHTEMLMKKRFVCHAEISFGSVEEDERLSCQLLDQPVHSVGYRPVVARQDPDFCSDFRYVPFLFACLFQPLRAAHAWRESHPIPRITVHTPRLLLAAWNKS